MFSIIASKVGEAKVNSLINGKELIILDKRKGTQCYFPLEEYVGFIISIVEFEKNPSMSKITLLFANGQLVKTVAFIEKDIIKEHMLVSVIGYISMFNNEPQLTCCGGIEKVFNTVPDMFEYGDILNFDYCHKMTPIFKLSEVKESKMYRESSNILPFEDTKFFYIEEDIKLKGNVHLDPEDIIEKCKKYMGTGKKQTSYDEMYEKIEENEITNVNSDEEKQELGNSRKDTNN